MRTIAPPWRSLFLNTVYERELFDFFSINSASVGTTFITPDQKLSYNTQLIILLLLYIYVYCNICYPLFVCLFVCLFRKLFINVASAACSLLDAAGVFALFLTWRLRYHSQSLYLSLADVVPGVVRSFAIRAQAKI